MNAALGVLVLILLLGLFVRKFDNKTRLLLICILVGMLLYLYISKSSG
jgi:hypothetical protein